jgi:hypothetical protein
MRLSLLVLDPHVGILYHGTEPRPSERETTD